jgi:hypothetical protein
MNLKDSVRQSRVRGRAKEPFPPSLFSRLGGLVRRHRLGEAFSRLVGLMTAEQAEKLAQLHRSETKPPYEPPLFFLATPEEYRVIQGILSVLDNPYLAWAQNPEEILFSQPLWRRHPGLSPEVLASHHFAELFLLS